MTEIRRRHVFFISGFDPRGVRHYHQMYREHAAKQSAINGLSLEVSGKRRVSDESYIWQAVSTKGVNTDIEFLSWDDIIRREWARGLPALWRDNWRCLKAGLFKGTLLKFSRARKSWLKVAAFFQFFYLPCIFGLALWLAASVQNVALGCAAAAALVWAGLKIGERYAVFWLLRICAFTTRYAHGEIEGIEERIDAFASRIRAALLSGVTDEVMVVGHSIGSILAVPVLLRALRGLPADKKIMLMTLGQCIPLATFHPKADACRRDLAELAGDDRVLWVDYSAPPDGAGFPQLDPVAASGCIGKGPKILSPRFFRLYKEENYKRLKYDWFNLHFLYMQSSDYAGDYDYFDITAGPRPFAERVVA